MDVLFVFSVSEPVVIVAININTNQIKTFAYATCNEYLHYQVSCLILFWYFFVNKILKMSPRHPPFDLWSNNFQAEWVWACTCIQFIYSMCVYKCTYVRELVYLCLLPHSILVCINRGKPGKRIRKRGNLLFWPNRLKQWHCDLP